MMFRQVCVSSLVLAAVSAGGATAYKWNNPEGGDLLEPANYTPNAVIPMTDTAKDTVTYNLDATYTLTASGNVPHLGAQTFANGNVEIALGPWAWAAGNRNFAVDDNTAHPVVTISSGTLTGISQCAVGTAGADCHLVVTNGSSVTSSSTVVGGSGAGNSLTVTDGSSYETGALTISNAGAAESNAVYVLNGSTVKATSLASKTSGSSLVISNQSQVTVNGAIEFAKAETCRLNRFEVLDGSTFQMGGKASSFSFGVGSDNTMIVDASTVSLTKDLTFGTRTGNRLEVRNGGQLEAASSIACGTSTGSYNEFVLKGPGTKMKTTSNTSLIVGNSGTGNVVRVSNGAAVDVFGVTIGWQPGSLSNAVEVTGGSSVNVRGTNLSIGTGGGGARLLIDDSIVTNVANACMPAKSVSTVGTDNNSLEILNGGKLYVNTTVFFGGVGNTNNAIRVAGKGSLLKTLTSNMQWANSSENTVLRVEDGATVDIAYALQVGTATAGAENGMIVSDAAVKAANISVFGDAVTEVVGSQASVETSGNFRTYPSTTLRYVSDRNGFGKVVANVKLQADAGAKLVINARKVARAGGGTFELMTAGSQKGAGISPEILDNVTMDPADCELIQEKTGTLITKLSVKVPAKVGLVILLR